MTVRNEIIRKSIHLFALSIPVGYMILDKKTTLLILGSATFFALCVELARFLWSDFSRWFYRSVGNLLREHEQSDLTGATYLLIGSFLTILFFDKWIALAALFFLVVADAFGALVGRFWGKHSLYKDKMIEGSVIFLLTALVVVFFIPENYLVVGFVGVATAFLIDVFVKRIDDNVAIPLGSGAVMQVLLYCLR